MKGRLADRDGFTLVELLLAMTMSLIAAGAGLTLMGAVANRNAQNSERSDAVTKATIGLERMTKEMRQASWLRFQGPQLVDMDVLLRDTAGGAARHRLVRFDCSANARCVRYEGPPTSYPPPASPTFTSSSILVEGVKPTADLFVPEHVDPATGLAVRDYLTPTSVDIALQMKLTRWTQDVRLEDSVMLRNASTFRS